MTNTTTPNLTVIIPTYTKLAQLKLEPHYSKNLIGGNKVTVAKSVRVNSNTCDSQDTCNSYIRFFICDLPSVRGQACQRGPNRVGRFFLLIE